ncbi:hypothetical protein [Halorussus halophilus]|uniref:hypothetical protein n=1 Tax=Halorussus halophilus TaxID=2650975 RepID=UPI001301388C|nr:hypothetical protein [Halorussus halophilus]
MTDLASFFFLAETTAMVVASLLLVYPVVAYARNVAYTRGLLLLAASFLTVTVSYVVWAIFHMNVLSSALDLLAAVVTAAGIWQFARPFVRFGDETFETRPSPEKIEETNSEATGGFDSARDD